jgi:hypothetical protein
LAYRRLFIWVEGADDQRFFEQVVKPLFEQKYDWVEVRTYAKHSGEYITKFIRSIKAMEADYIFVADIDSAPCITARKERLQETYKNVDEDKTLVVIQEIESWYLAGLNDANAKRLGLPVFNATDSITKEQFDPLIPKRFDS